MLGHLCVCNVSVNVILYLLALDIQDPCSETDCKASPLDFPLCQPKDVLEQIALHPFREFESLLIDVSKLAISTKNSNDLRSGKHVSRRPSLPSFPWSHAFGGNFRTNSDTAKLSTSRSTCRGKWARIGLIASSTDIDRSSFTDLDSFSYDQSLVPSSGNSDSKLIQSYFANLPFRRLDSSSSVSCSKEFQVNTGKKNNLLPKFVYLYFSLGKPLSIPNFSACYHNWPLYYRIISKRS